jgi:colicin import membrane protein
MGGLQEKEADAKKAAVEAAAPKDYNDTLALLKGEAKAQKSGLVPADVKNPANPEVGSTARALASDAEKAKAEAEAKAKAEADSKKLQSGEGVTPGRRAPAPAAQESAETLLASLNSKLDQLIRVNRENKEVAEAQLSVQKGLTGNLLVHT